MLKTINYLTFAQNGAVTITEYGDSEAAVVLLQMVGEQDMDGLASEAAEIRKLTERKFCLTAVKVNNWNHDLSPWKAPAVFGREDFGDGAKEKLAEVLKICSDPEKTYIIGGYSLAGLFALWAAYQTDVFRASAAASPSVWFPGFIDYMKEHRPKSDAVYLSLGDREEKTRNPVMAAVGGRIREAHRLLEEQGMKTAQEWNPGNHFRNAEMRTARAFAWAMRQSTEVERKKDSGKPCGVI